VATAPFGKFATCCYRLARTIRAGTPNGMINLPEPRAILSLVFLLAGAAASIYISSQPWDERETERRPELSLAYYLDQAELIGTGEDGEILYQVSTRRAAQRPDDETIEMDQVHMIYGAPTALPWELNADSGRIPADASVIELIGNVVAISSEEGKAPTIIRTQRLDIDPMTRQASTNEKVQLEFGDRILNATGMEANFETNKLDLLADVNGKFAP
jgi:LPS export ABC transporter protein LptC